MMKNVIIAVAVTLGSFLISFGVFMYLYPQMNPDVFEALKKDVEQQNVRQTGYQDALTFLKERYELATAVATVMDTVKSVVKQDTVVTAALPDPNLALEKARNARLTQSLDSLNREMTRLRQAHSTELADLRKRVLPVFSTADNKSLLNLDDEELKPILRQLNQRQIQAIYLDANASQREKLLRNLNPEAAARLLSEIIKN
jgi:hypothetical protein